MIRSPSNAIWPLAMGQQHMRRRQEAICIAIAHPKNWKNLEINACYDYASSFLVTIEEAREYMLIAALQVEKGKPLKRSIENAKERTKAVREKVKSSLTNLTPRENIYNLPN
ncbi:hypothetical protein KC319_g3478, partial [Hortaea werneckii]